MVSKEIFEIFENSKKVWEEDDLGDIFAINYDIAKNLLKNADVKEGKIDNTINFLADYYGVDVD